MKIVAEKSILNPIAVYFLITLLTFSNYLIRPDMRVFPQRTWLPNSDFLEILLIATSAGFFGIISGRLINRNRKFIFTDFELEAQAKTLDKFGSLFFLISCIGYLVWILSDLRGWFTYQTSGHLRTIPGVTTLTQLMTMAIVCLFTARLIGFKRTNQKWKIFFGIFITLIRSQVNHERLALLEILLPLFVVWLVHNRHKIKVNSLFIYSAFAICFYLFFSVNEYFRSWQYYRIKTDINFFSFTFHRLLDYYSTSLNNGSIYINYHAEISRVPIIGLDFVWNFPLFGPILLEHFNGNSSSLSWSRILRIVSGTDEFNNLHVYPSLYADFGPFGMVSVLFIVALCYSTAYYKMINGDYRYLVGYSILTVGVIELPREFWFGSGRAFPIIVALVTLHIFLYKSKKVLQYENSILEGPK